MGPPPNPSSPLFLPLSLPALSVSHPQVANCVCDGKAAGILFEDEATGRFTHNIVCSNQNEGVAVHGRAHPTLECNVVLQVVHVCVVHMCVVHVCVVYFLGACVCGACMCGACVCIACVCAACVWCMCVYFVWVCCMWLFCMCVLCVYVWCMYTWCMYVLCMCVRFMNVCARVLVFVFVPVCLHTHTHKHFFLAHTHTYSAVRKYVANTHVCPVVVVFVVVDASFFGLYLFKSHFILITPPNTHTTNPPPLYPPPHTL